MRTQLDVLRLVHLRELRTRPLRTAIAVVAVAAGVAMLLAIAIVVRSTTVSFEHQAEALAGPAPLRVVGVTPGAGLEPVDVDTIRSVDGVFAAAPTVRGLAAIERPAEGGGVVYADEVLVLGVECDVAQLFGVTCDSLSDGLLVTPSLADDRLAGDRLRTDVGPVALADVALTPEPRLGVLGPRVAVTSLARAQRYLGRGDAIDTVYVLPAEDADLRATEDRLEEALPVGLEVLGATDLPPELDQVLGTIVPLFGLIGVLAFGVGAILVANTVALSLEERRVQLAVVAALGGTRRHVFVGALVQAGVLGAAGGLLGAGLAALAAYPLTASVSQFTLGIAGIRVDALPSQTPVVAAVIMGSVVAVIAAWRPARRATRVDVAAELSLRERRDESGVKRLSLRAGAASVVGVALGALAIAGGADGSLESWQPPAAWLGLLGAVVSLSFAVGYVGAVVATWLLRSVKLRAPAPHLALANLVREPSRTAIMVLAAGAAIGVGYISDSYISMAQAGILEGVTSDQGDGLSVTVGPSDGGEVVFSRLPPEVVDSVTSHPQVGTVQRFAFVFTNAGGPAIGITGIEGELSGPRVYDGEADTSRFAAGEAMIGAGLARTQDVRAGGTVVLPTRDGDLEVPVQGVWANGNAVGNSIMLPLATVQEHYGPVPIGGMYVTPSDGVTVDELAAGLADDIDDSALRVETAQDVADRFAGQVVGQMAPFRALQGGLTVLAFVAVLSTLLLVGVQRQREFGLLAATGMTPRSTFVMVVWEAAIVGVIGAAVILPFATLQGLAFKSVAPLILGWENPTRFDLGAWGTYSVITIAVMVVGAVLPAMRASRVDVVDALAYE